AMDLSAAIPRVARRSLVAEPDLRCLISCTSQAGTGARRHGTGSSGVHLPRVARSRGTMEADRCGPHPVWSDVHRNFRLSRSDRLGSDPSRRLWPDGLGTPTDI